MKKIILLFLLIALLNQLKSNSYLPKDEASNEKINYITKGKRIYIDGVIEEGEWCDSKVFLFDSVNNIKTKAYLKHDGKNLLFAFIFENGNDSIVNTIPEFFIDTKNNKGESWQNDDYWFHISAQDCYAVGKREDYSNCRPDYLVWRASPNHPFGDGSEEINVFEASVPFELINIDVNDTIGLCLSVFMYPGDTRINFPIKAKADIPDTWIEFIIQE